MPKKKCEKFSSSYQLTKSSQVLSDEDSEDDFLPTFVRTSATPSSDLTKPSREKMQTASSTQGKPTAQPHTVVNISSSTLSSTDSDQASTHACRDGGSDKSLRTQSKKGSTSTSIELSKEVMKSLGCGSTSFEMDTDAPPNTYCGTPGSASKRKKPSKSCHKPITDYRTIESSSGSSEDPLPQLKKPRKTPNVTKGNIPKKNGGHAKKVVDSESLGHQSKGPSFDKENTVTLSSETSSSPRRKQQRMRSNFLNAETEVLKKLKRLKEITTIELKSSSESEFESVMAKTPTGRRKGKKQRVSRTSLERVSSVITSESSDSEEDTPIDQRIAKRQKEIQGLLRKEKLNSDGVRKVAQSATELSPVTSVKKRGSRQLTYDVSTTSSSVETDEEPQTLSSKAGSNKMLVQGHTMKEAHVVLQDFVKAAHRSEPRRKPTLSEDVYQELHSTPNRDMESDDDLFITQQSREEVSVIRRDDNEEIVDVEHEPNTIKQTLETQYSFDMEFDDDFGNDQPCAEQSSKTTGNNAEPYVAPKSPHVSSGSTINIFIGTSEPSSDASTTVRKKSPDGNTEQLQTTSPMPDAGQEETPCGDVPGSDDSSCDDVQGQKPEEIQQGEDKAEIKEEAESEEENAYFGYSQEEAIVIDSDNEEDVFANLTQSAFMVELSDDDQYQDSDGGVDVDMDGSWLPDLLDDTQFSQELSPDISHEVEGHSRSKSPRKEKILTITGSRMPEVKIEMDDADFTGDDKSDASEVSPDENSGLHIKEKEKILTITGSRMPEVEIEIDNADFTRDDESDASEVSPVENGGLHVMEKGVDPSTSTAKPPTAAPQDTPVKQEQLAEVSWGEDDLTEGDVAACDKYMSQLEGEVKEEDSNEFKGGQLTSNTIKIEIENDPKSSGCDLYQKLSQGAEVPVDDLFDDNSDEETLMYSLPIPTVEEYDSMRDEDVPDLAQDVSRPDPEPPVVHYVNAIKSKAPVTQNSAENQGPSSFMQTDHFGARSVNRGYPEDKSGTTERPPPPSESAPPVVTPTVSSEQAVGRSMGSHSSCVTKSGEGTVLKQNQQNKEQDSLPQIIRQTGESRDSKATRNTSKKKKVPTATLR